ncbi:homoserine dehydrogenase [Tindallia californiensis]|uniref:Homoserine dehydrogenase n=1 Tax=Tindallia californiensis TaxID=159292 RepID=A0A1H3LF64_9FIRM|nr:homoserine dehydrogenase [Tindallia californiensis]SDY62594.1 homoserine dehydrogenase [Tindallia californiensis]
MKIGIIGNGGVGKALIRLIHEKKETLAKEGLTPVICAHLDSTGGIYDLEGIDLKRLMQHNEKKEPLKDFPKGGSAGLSIDDILEEKSMEVLIELTPTNKKTGEPGIGHITKALENEIHVITANKGPVMIAYHSLKALANRKRRQFWIGCTTGGALPAINGGLIDLAGSEITSITGVLNGTTNYILEEMKTRECTYREALQKAQKDGIAETDPSLDVEGWDTAMKLLILTNVLMNQNKQLSDIKVRGITEIDQAEIGRATGEGGKIKLVGRTRLEKEKILMTVQPETLYPEDFLFQVDGKNKGVHYTTDTLGDIGILGGASGLTAAAASVLRDLINLHRGGCG